MDLAPADPEIEVVLTMDPAASAIGRVREVAPRADAVTGTFEVKVRLADPPAAMPLGSTVTGRMQLGGAGGIEVPASALTQADGQAAVWVVDAASETVALRNIEVLRHDPARVPVALGLETVPGRSPGRARNVLTPQHRRPWPYPPDIDVTPACRPLSRRPPCSGP